MLVIKAATEENLSFSKEAAPDMTIKAVCKSDKEVEIFYKEIIRFIRRVGHIKKQKVNYEIVLESLENRTTRIIRNKSSVTDINENGKTAPEVPVQEQPINKNHIITKITNILIGEKILANEANMLLDQVKKLIPTYYQFK